MCRHLHVIPNMILILVLASVLGQSVTTVTLVIGFLGWTEFARLIYASVLSVREKDYVESAKAIGAKNGTILLRYVLPNSLHRLSFPLHSEPLRRSLQSHP